MTREIRKYEAGRAPRRVKKIDGDTIASTSSDDEVEIVEENVLVRQAAPPAVPNR